jgi:hypothetical protein
VLSFFLKAQDVKLKKALKELEKTRQELKITLMEARNVKQNFRKFKDELGNSVQEKEIATQAKKKYGIKEELEESERAMDRRNNQPKRLSEDKNKVSELCFFLLIVLIIEIYSINIFSSVYVYVLTVSLSYSTSLSYSHITPMNQSNKCNKRA